MQKQSSLRKLRRVDPDSAPAEFEELLREIENEPVPDRLLELALQLQAALAERRRRLEGDGGSSAE